VEFFNVKLLLHIQWGVLQRMMLQGTRRNTIGRRSTRVRMTCRAFRALIRALVIFVIICKVELSV